MIPRKALGILGAMQALAAERAEKAGYFDEFYNFKINFGAQPILSGTRTQGYKAGLGTPAGRPVKAITVIIKFDFMDFMVISHA
jgi:hypothetical protein